RGRGVRELEAAGQRNEPEGNAREDEGDREVNHMRVECGQGRISMPFLARAAPVAVQPAEKESGRPHRQGEKRQADRDADASRPGRPGRRRELGKTDRKHDGGVADGSVAAERAVAAMRKMDVAERIASSPQRPTSAGEDPGAGVDEGRAGDAEGEGEGHHAGRRASVALAIGLKELVWYENPRWERHVLASGLNSMINVAAYDTDGDGIPELVLAYEFSTTHARSLGIIALLSHGADPRAP